MNFVNQTRIMTEIIPMMAVARNGVGFNILFQGPAGCGKTTLAHTFCSKSCKPGERYSKQIPINGKVNTRGITQYRVNLIDEVHKLTSWETLYPLMDTGEKILVFCTTEYGELPEPFLSRCYRFTFDRYSLEHLTLILIEYATKRRFPLETKDCYELIARVSRGSPRIAKQRFDRVKLLLVSNCYPPSEKYISFVLDKIGIFKNGYTTEDMKYLTFLSEIGQCSISNITRSLQIDRATVEREIEPYLLENKNIEISSRGRKFICFPE